MSQLVLNNNSASNPQTIDLTPYMDVNEGQGMDLSDPAFTNRVWSRSLLKHGATLALEQLVEKELTFPLKIGPIGGVAGAPTTLSQTLQFVQNINMILETPGATATWQPIGASQPTTFDLLSGQLEVAYNYRAEQQRWTFGNLRLFTQPLGRTAAPRVYATASGVGPLLMISPYASSGAQAIGASTQAGVAGFGGQQQGASSGVFYWGSPSLAGDAPALLQISYVGPLPNTATNTGVVPTVAVSLLPDANYRALVTAPEIAVSNLSSATNRRVAQTSIASSYLSLSTSAQNTVYDAYSFNPLNAPSDAGLEPAVSWSGQHRLLAIARASSTGAGASAILQPIAGALVQTQLAPVSIGPVGFDWDLYDLGTFTIRPSEFPQAQLQVQATLTSYPGASAALDVAAFVMLPDNRTWFLNPAQIQPSQYGYPQSIASSWGVGGGAWTNTILLDDVLSDQFIYLGASQRFAPSPIGSVPSATRVTPYTRGLLPQPDPKDGLPVVAIVGVGQNIDAPLTPALSFPTFTGGPVTGGTAIDSAAVGTVAWSGSGGSLQAALATKGDGVLARTAGMVSGAVSHYLEATNFGFAIPSNATITGISVYIGGQLSESGAGIQDSEVKLMKAGTVQTTNRAQIGVNWPTSPYTNNTYGGAADLWGGTWAPADINNSGFGIAISCVNAGPNSVTHADIDYLTITVYYTFGSPPLAVASSSQAVPQNQATYAQVNVLERFRYVAS